jgi:hypothetical protein
MTEVALMRYTVWLHTDSLIVEDAEIIRFVNVSAQELGEISSFADKLKLWITIAPLEEE